MIANVANGDAPMANQLTWVHVAEGGNFALVDLSDISSLTSAMSSQSRCAIVDENRRIVCFDVRNGPGFTPTWDVLFHWGILSVVFWNCISYIPSKCPVV